jgi:hypothetical protein
MALIAFVVSYCLFAIGRIKENFWIRRGERDGAPRTYRLLPEGPGTLRVL